MGCSPTWINVGSSFTKYIDVYGFCLPTKTVDFLFHMPSKISAALGHADKIFFLIFFSCDDFKEVLFIVSTVTSLIIICISLWI